MAERGRPRKKVALQEGMFGSKELSEIYKSIQSSKTNEQRQDNLVRFMMLLKEDPRYMETCLRMPELLLGRIKYAESNSAPLIHSIAHVYPTESLRLFDFLREDTTTYLQVLRAKNSGGTMAGVRIVMRVLKKDEALNSNTARLTPEERLIKYVLQDEWVGNKERESPFKARLIESVKNNPEMQNIFKMTDFNKTTVAHIWASNPYLAPALIELTKGKPFFPQIMDQQNKNGLKVWTTLLAVDDNSGMMSRLSEALEAISPISATKRLLESSAYIPELGTIHLANVLASYNASAMKLNGLIRRNPKLENIKGLEIVNELGAREAVGDTLKKTIRSVQ